MKKREYWIDNVKVIACILVVLGHFYSSMTMAEVLPDNHFYHWFLETIYYFHVPLFFICSGYLYQKYEKVNSIQSWSTNVIKKFLVLGIPYFTFSIATYVLKRLFEGEVNTSEGELFEVLFLKPLSPYWYLYILFFIFVITVTVKSKKGAFVLLIVSFLGKLFVMAEVVSLPFAVEWVLINEIWFVIGMCICVFDLYKYLNIKMAVIGAVFLPLTILLYINEIQFFGKSFLLGIMGCLMVLSICYVSYQTTDQQSLFFSLLSKYMFPIYLLHTICAAGLRSVLFKLHITSPFIHILTGLIISFVGPIAVAFIMEKTKFLDILLYPNKYIKFKKRS